MFKSATIGKKLFLGIGLLLALTLGLGATALEGLFRIGTAVDTTLAGSVRKLTLAHTIDRDNSDLMSYIRGMMLRGFMKDKPAIENYRIEFAETNRELNASISELTALVHREDAKEALHAIQSGTDGLHQAEERLAEAALTGDMDTASEVNRDKVLPEFKRIKEQSVILLKVQDEVMATDSAKARGSIVTSTWIMTVFVGISCLVGFALVMAVRGIVDTLRLTVEEMADAAVQIADATGHVAHSSQQLSQGASEQARTIERTSSAATEIQSMAQRATDNCQGAATIVGRSQQSFQQTNRSLTDLVAAMRGIDESSQKISQIIKVIDGIAFQTNILALNAAVEAARAGEAGMGFAVVADEVRSLAQRSAQAAKDTSALIEESIERSHRGRNKVEEVAVAVRAVTTEADQISALVEQIKEGSVQQSTGIDQITQAITELEEETQSNAAGSEEGAGAAEELSAQAASLNDVVERLRHMVNGNATGEARPSRHFAVPRLAPA